MSRDLMDWAFANGLADRRETTRGEFVLLASALSIAVPLVATLRFTDPTIAAQAHLFLPAFFPRVEPDPEHLEFGWVTAALRGERRRIGQADDPVVQAHEVLWSTRFAQAPTRAPRIARRLQRMLRTTSDPDHAALLSVALLGVGEEPDENKLATGLPASWDDYHPCLVADYYRALKARGGRGG